jgi:hypothetical protein
LQKSGFKIDEKALAEDEAELAMYDDADRFPNDRELIEGIGLHAFYSRVYRISSDYAHFSLGIAIKGMDAEIVTFEHDDGALATEALELATLIYGLFLTQSDRTIKHGLSKRSQEIIRASPVSQET